VYNEVILIVITVIKERTNMARKVIIGDENLLFVTILDAAKMLGINYQTVRTWGKKGKIQQHKNPVTGSIVFERKQIEKMAEEIKTWKKVE
jgi:hypothetical protein